MTFEFLCSKIILIFETTFYNTMPMSAVKFQNKYRIPSARLQNWDYGWSGYYFITCCTKYRKHYLGEIKDKKMYLSPVGEIVERYWNEIPEHFPFVELHAFIVMPNHIHGIVYINDVRDKNNIDIARTCPGYTIGQKRQGNQGKNTLSSIIGSFKAAVTRNAHRLHYEFVWQTRFYDHIIRNEQSYENIHNYILTNPQCWVDDKFYSYI